MYLQSLDLQEWWDEFAHSHKRNGTQTYPTVWSFVKKKAKVKWQRDFLYWLLGPIAEGESPYPGITQLDFNGKRERGFWHSSTNIENFKKEVNAKASSFQRIQSAGNSLLEDLARLGELQKKIDNEYGGALHLPDNTVEENHARVSMYMSLTQQLMTMKQALLHTYAKTQGMDMSQLSNFINLFASGMGRQVAAQLGFGEAETAEKEETTFHKVLNQFSEMTLRKSAQMGLPLPAEMETAAVEIITPTKKRSVQ